MERSRLRWAACGSGALGVVSLLFFPFSGFTERTAYVPSPIFRDYGLTGIGTYGQDFSLFGYPAGLWFVQLLVLALGVVLGFGVWQCLRLARGTSVDTGRLVRLGLGVAAGSILLTIVALTAVFPSVEEQTIWVTESNGWIEDWWVAYGAFLSPLAAAGMALLVRAAPGERAAPPAPPPAE